MGGSTRPIGAFVGAGTGGWVGPGRGALVGKGPLVGAMGDKKGPNEITRLMEASMQGSISSTRVKGESVGARVLMSGFVTTMGAEVLAGCLDSPSGIVTTIGTGALGDALDIALIAR